MPAKRDDASEDWEEDPPAIGVILHENREQTEELLAAFAFALRATGCDAGGLVQVSGKTSDGRRQLDLVDIRTGQTFRISQDLGPGSESCILDLGGLAAASLVLRREIDHGAALLIVNKFAKAEFGGNGLAAETFEAVSRGIPVLTSVAARYRRDWDAMTGGAGQFLDGTAEALWAWWAGVNHR